ncbi:MAG: extracellular solute-binding protein [Proteobacteria bacterium]|nr:extracellular solute-binding protein [Pseudomonadota bacterium]NIS71039.1 extracellular solute-binding protein [Pseudomonadota bacterium]
MRKRKIDELVEAFAEGRLTRRDFIRKATALGFSLAVSMSIARDFQSREAYAAEVDRSKLSKELNIYNWSDYIAEDTIPNFEKEFGVKVNYDTYEDNEAMLAKLQAGATGYDLVVPTGYMVEIMLKQNMLAPINHENIPNIKSVSKELANPPYDPGRKYTVPWQWGTTGFGYNSKEVTGKIDSWGLLWSSKYKGKITMLDDMRSVISVALKKLGYPLNSTSEKELMEAKKLLMDQKPLLKAYISAPVKSLLISGEVWLSHLWVGDVLMAKEENDALEYCIPKEGCEIWDDSLAIPKTAPHKYTAEVWMNYCLRPEVSAAVSNFVHYATPVEAAKKFINKEDLDNPGIYPPPDVMTRLEFQVDIGEATRIYDQIWTELKAA